ncbi:acyl-CoA carboxylase subunit epsilon [Streptomyces sp. NPDC007100]|uniref:acyl-CoA carboxylase subunit epsilon n=1 Tax=Streptomyces sp. NPDC007100 TaxID=3155602 RepID=UPI0033F0B659
MPVPEPGASLFRIVRGTADATELAALTAVLMARAAHRDSPQPATTEPAPVWRRPAYHPPGSWRRAA